MKFHHLSPVRPDGPLLKKGGRFFFGNWRYLRFGAKVCVSLVAGPYSDGVVVGAGGKQGTACTPSEGGLG